MNKRIEELTTNFYAWELLGRGWLLHDQRVDIEPPFVPFFQHRLLGSIHAPSSTRVDDGDQPALMCTVLKAVWNHFKSKKKEPPPPWINPYLTEPFPPVEYGSLVTSRVYLPRDWKANPTAITHILSTFSTSTIPLYFEIVGTEHSLSLYVATALVHHEWLRDQFKVRFPRLMLYPAEHTFYDVSLPRTLTDYGLSQEFTRPLTAPSSIPYHIIAALESFREGELGVYQVMMQGTLNPWAPSIKRSVSDGVGGSFFQDAPEMVSLGREKTKHALCSVCVRSYVQAQDYDRMAHLDTLLQRAIVTGTRSVSNSLIPLSREGLHLDRDDLINRSSHRYGMILNVVELAHLIDFPEVYGGKLVHGFQMSVPTPDALRGNSMRLGINEHLGRGEDVTVNHNQRLRHTHIIGATGTGKSTLLLQMMVQDVQNGKGLLLLDPHGDVADSLLNYIPQERIQDVIFIDPSDSKYPIGINLFHATSESERIVLSSDLLGIFKSFATSWGDTMDAILGNAIDVMLQHPDTKTLVDLRFFLSNAQIRKETLHAIDDPYVRNFWEHEFPLMRKNAVSPLTTRLDTFLRTSVIRAMMSQKTGIDFSSILSTQKIVIVKLAQGLIGEANSYLLGSLITTKLYQAALGRQGKERLPFFMYIDEFQYFMTPSTESLLSGARKFGLGLILAHQGLDQISDRKVLQSILTNVGVRIVLRVGEGDAAKLEHSFSHFDRKDLMNLSVGQAIVRAGRSDNDCLIQTLMLEDSEQSYKDEIVAFSRREYGGSSDIETPQPQQPRKPIKETPIVVEKPPEETVKGKATDVVQPESIPPQPSPSFEQEAEEFKQKEQKRITKREHRRLQELIRKQAHQYHFKAVIEQAVENPKGRVDVALYSDTLSIACEVSVTTPPSYELKNIQKGISNGFHVVAMCSQDARHLAAITSLAQEHLAPEEIKKVFFGTVQEFLSLLDRLVEKEPPSVKRTRGYRVKVNYQNVTTGDAQQRMDEIVRAMLKRKKE